MAFGVALAQPPTTQRQVVAVSDCWTCGAEVARGFSVVGAGTVGEEYWFCKRCEVSWTTTPRAVHDQERA
jgi:hypothetical protein